MPNSYEDLQVWQKAMDLATDVYRATEGFPRKELYGLTAQVRQASVSVPSNIAEGKGRSDADFARFLLQARGSLWEVETQLLLSGRLGYLGAEDVQRLRRSAGEVGRLLSGLIKAIKPTPRGTGAATGD